MNKLKSFSHILFYFLPVEASKLLPFLACSYGIIFSLDLFTLVDLQLVDFNLRKLVYIYVQMFSSLIKPDSVCYKFISSRTLISCGTSLLTNTSLLAQSHFRLPHMQATATVNMQLHKKGAFFYLCNLI